MTISLPLTLLPIFPSNLDYPPSPTPCAVHATTDVFLRLTSTVSWSHYYFISPPGFIDSTTLTDSVGCGQYREYVKHGAKSGYSYDQWVNAVDDCPIPVYPHQCRYNGSHNIIQSLSTFPLGTVGCRSAPNISNCFF